MPEDVANAGYRVPDARVDRTARNRGLQDVHGAQDHGKGQTGKHEATHREPPALVLLVIDGIQSGL